MRSFQPFRRFGNHFTRWFIIPDGSESTLHAVLSFPTIREAHFMLISTFPTIRKAHFTLVSPIRRFGKHILCSFHCRLNWFSHANSLLTRRNNNGFPETLYLCAVLALKRAGADIYRKGVYWNVLSSTSQTSQFEPRRQGNGRCLRSCIHAASCASAHEVRLYIYLRGLRRCLSLGEGNAKAWDVG